jgi:hypothetical protein
MHSRTRTVVVLLVVASAVLAGCSGAMSSGDSGEPTGQSLSMDDNAATEAAADSADSGASDDSNYQGKSLDSSATVQRSLIMTGEVRLEVEDFDATREAVVAAARERDGYVSGSDVTRHREANRTWKTGQVVLRVPGDDFEDLMAAVEDSGTVIASNTDSKDVTDQLVDIEARLENLRAQRERLRDLYEDANETEDVLEVQERLSETQMEIERLEAKQRSLQDRVAYSTVTVRIQEPRPDEPSITEEHRAWYETGVLAAFLESIDGVVVVVRALVVGVAYALPYLAVFGIPLGGMALVLRRRGLP